MAGTGTPPREKARIYRTGRPDRLCSLLFAVAALILCAGIGAVLWHEWQGTRPTAAEQAEADEIERADGGEEAIAAATADYDLPEGVHVFLFVGRMMWYKGLRIILDALKLLQAGGTV